MGETTAPNPPDVERGEGLKHANRRETKRQVTVAVPRSV